MTIYKLFYIAVFIAVIIVTLLSYHAIWQGSHLWNHWFIIMYVPLYFGYKIGKKRKQKS